jgi:hypothetical protein
VNFPSTWKQGILKSGGYSVTWNTALLLVGTVLGIMLFRHLAKNLPSGGLDEDFARIDPPSE